MSRAIVLALAAASLLATPSIANPRSIPSQTFPSPFGVNLHFTQGGPGEVKALSKVFKVARMDFFWDGIEKVRGEYNFAKFDILVRDLEANGVRPLFILDYGNHIYGPGPVRTAVQRKAYAAFCAAAVKHYKGHKIMWEFWNEPNLVGFWGDRADPEEYAAMVNAAAPGMLKADPNVTLLLGAFSGFPWDFMDTVFKRGCLKWADAVTVHPYRSGNPETAERDYVRLRRVLAQYSPGHEIPILSGEWGYSTNRKTGIPELRQAQYLVRQRLNNVRCGILTSIWYDWKDDGPDPNENEHRFGSTQQDFTPKPSYTAARVMTATLAGFKFVRMLADGPLNYVMLLRNAKGESALALWTLNASNTYRLPALPKKIVGLLGESITPARDLKIGPSPVYALLGKTPVMEAWSFIRPYTVLVAGRKQKISFTISHSGSRARVVNVGFALRGGTVVPKAAKVIVAPGGQASVPITLDLWARDEESSVTVTIDGKRTVVPLVIANPVSVSVNGATRGSIVVTLDAPGVRAAETLTVRQTGSDGKGVGPGVPVRLKPGTTSYSVNVPLQSAHGVLVRYGAVVTDSHGRIVASLPPMSFVPLLSLEDDQSGTYPSALSVYHEGDEKPGGTVKMVTADTAGHGNVVDIRAVFPDGWRYFVVTPQKTAIPDSAVAVGMWVNGDACGDIIRVRIVDAAGQTIQPTYGPINWKGWRWITMRLDDQSVGSWGGPQDGKIHKPIKWDSVFLLDSGTRKAHTAHVQFTGLTLMTN
jgi:polysaccharide biosynthesis protein PslG